MPSVLLSLLLTTSSERAMCFCSGINKREYWNPTLEDSLNLIARLPRVAALIYRNSFMDGKIVADDPGLDYSANFNRYVSSNTHPSRITRLSLDSLLGFNSSGRPTVAPTDPDAFDELMRLYLVIHADHEGT